MMLQSSGQAASKSTVTGSKHLKIKRFSLPSRQNRPASSRTQTIDRNLPTLRINDRIIQEVAKERFSDSSIAAIVFKQAVYEGITRFRTHVSFRHRENTDAVQAYLAMNLNEFHGINARQAWANWRTVPKNLNGNLENRSMKALDLCCGTGQSTQVLSYYLAPGSEILGLEYNPQFVELARQREYLDENRQPVPVQFRAQSVLETFRDLEGEAIADQAVDLVNSCGAIGHHFDPQATELLSNEVARVLKSGGLALIDSGPHGTSTADVKSIFTKRGFEVLGTAKSCFADIYTQVCFRKK